MGVYVNPGNTAFQKALNSDIYIDKTNLISYTNSRIDKTDCFVCVSRPRRFGKSMAADMLLWLTTAKAVIPPDYLQAGGARRINYLKNI